MGVYILSGRDSLIHNARAGSSDLHQLTYVSYATPACLINMDAEIVSILSSARKHNVKGEVTGALIAHNGFFVQLLEGPEDNLYDVFRNICMDMRHIGVTVVSEGAVEDREFGEWSMCAVQLSNTDGKILEKLNLKTDFDPLKCPPKLLLTLLKTIVGVQKAAGRNAT